MRIHRYTQTGYPPIHPVAGPQAVVDAEREMVVSDPELGEVVALGLHAASSPAAHLEVLDVPSGPVDLSIECEYGERCMAPKVYHQFVPKAYVGALVVAFHARHEGHPLVLKVDGLQLYP